MRRVIIYLLMASIATMIGICEEQDEQEVVRLVKIKVIDKQTREPVKGVIVELFTSSGNKFGSSKTDSEGIAVFSYVPVGRYKAKALSKDNYLSNTISVDVSIPENKTGEEVVIKKTIELLIARAVIHSVEVNGSEEPVTIRPKEKFKVAVQFENVGLVGLECHLRITPAIATEEEEIIRLVRLNPGESHTIVVEFTSEDTICSGIKPVIVRLYYEDTLHHEVRKYTTSKGYVKVSRLGAKISAINFDKASYMPGEEITITIKLLNLSGEVLDFDLLLAISDTSTDNRSDLNFTKEIKAITAYPDQEITLSPIKWTAPNVTSPTPFYICALLLQSNRLFDIALGFFLVSPIPESIRELAEIYRFPDVDYEIIPVKVDNSLFYVIHYLGDPIIETDGSTTWVSSYQSIRYAIVTDEHGMILREARLYRAPLFTSLAYRTLNEIPCQLLDQLGSVRQMMKLAEGLYIAERDYISHLKEGVERTKFIARVTKLIGAIIPVTISPLKSIATNGKLAEAAAKIQAIQSLPIFMEALSLIASTIGGSQEAGYPRGEILPLIPISDVNLPISEELRSEKSPAISVTLALLIVIGGVCLQVVGSLLEDQAEAEIRDIERYQGEVLSPLERAKGYFEEFKGQNALTAGINVWLTLLNFLMSEMPSYEKLCNSLGWNLDNPFGIKGDISSDRFNNFFNYWLLGLGELRGYAIVVNKYGKRPNNEKLVDIETLDGAIFKLTAWREKFKQQEAFIFYGSDSLAKIGIEKMSEMDLGMFSIGGIQMRVKLSPCIANVEEDVTVSVELLENGTPLAGKTLLYEVRNLETEEVISNGQLSQEDPGRYETSFKAPSPPLNIDTVKYEVLVRCDDPDISGKRLLTVLSPNAVGVITIPNAPDELFEETRELIKCIKQKHTVFTFTPLEFIDKSSDPGFLDFVRVVVIHDLERELSTPFNMEEFHNALKRYLENGGNVLLTGTAPLILDKAEITSGIFKPSWSGGGMLKFTAQSHPIIQGIDWVYSIVGSCQFFFDRVGEIEGRFKDIGVNILSQIERTSTPRVYSVLAEIGYGGGKIIVYPIRMKGIRTEGRELLWRCVEYLGSNESKKRALIWIEEFKGLGKEEVKEGDETEVVAKIKAMGGGEVEDVRVELLLPEGGGVKRLYVDGQRRLGTRFDKMESGEEHELKWVLSFSTLGWKEIKLRVRYRGWEDEVVEARDVVKKDIYMDVLKPLRVALIVYGVEEKEEMYDQLDEVGWEVEEVDQISFDPSEIPVVVIHSVEGDVGFSDAFYASLKEYLSKGGNVLLTGTAPLILDKAGITPGAIERRRERQSLYLEGEHPISRSLSWRNVWREVGCFEARVITDKAKGIGMDSIARISYNRSFLAEISYGGGKIIVYPIRLRGINTEGRELLWRCVEYLGSNESKKRALIWIEEFKGLGKEEVKEGDETEVVAKIKAMGGGEVEDVRVELLLPEGGGVKRLYVDGQRRLGTRFDKMESGEEHELKWVLSFSTLGWKEIKLRVRYRGWEDEVVEARDVVKKDIYMDVLKPLRVALIVYGVEEKEEMYDQLDEVGWEVEEVDQISFDPSEIPVVVIHSVEGDVGFSDAFYASLKEYLSKGGNVLLTGTAPLILDKAGITPGAIERRRERQSLYLEGEHPISRSLSWRNVWREVGCFEARVITDKAKGIGMDSIARISYNRSFLAEISYGGGKIIVYPIRLRGINTEGRELLWRCVEYLGSNESKKRALIWIEEFKGLGKEEVKEGDETEVVAKIKAMGGGEVEDVRVELLLPEGGGVKRLYVDGQRRLGTRFDKMESGEEHELKWVLSFSTLGWKEIKLRVRYRGWEDEVVEARDVVKKDIYMDVLKPLRVALIVYGVEEKEEMYDQLDEVGWEVEEVDQISFDPSEIPVVVIHSVEGDVGFSDAFYASLKEYLSKGGNVLLTGTAPLILDKAGITPKVFEGGGCNLCIQTTEHPITEDLEKKCYSGGAFKVKLNMDKLGWVEVINLGGSGRYSVLGELSYRSGRIVYYPISNIGRLPTWARILLWKSVNYLGAGALMITVTVDREYILGDEMEILVHVTFEGQPVNDAVVKGKIRDPLGNEYALDFAKAGTPGDYIGKFKLSPDMPGGSYKLEISAIKPDGLAGSTRKDFNVRAPIEVKGISVSLKLDKSRVAPGEKITASGKTIDESTNRPVGAVVIIRLLDSQGSKVLEFQTQSDPGTGDYSLTFTVPLTPGSYTVEATAEAEGLSGRTEAPLIISVLYGDVSGNGQITAYDAAMILRYLVGKEELSESQRLAGDVSGNGELSAYDAALIMQFVVGLIESFPRSQGAPQLEKRERKTLIVQTVKGKLGERVKVPIMIDDPSGIISGELEIRFDPSILKFLDADGAFELIEIARRGRAMKLAFAAGKAPRTSSILWLEFEVIGDKKDFAELEVTRCRLNEGVIARTTKGKVELIPTETVLFQNYPNPFNPDTWIPFKLAEDGRVVIRIYDMKGGLVRELDLGWKEAGSYTMRGRAAYWDGRNEIGEKVASGVYFYQMTVGRRSFIRRMMVLK